MSKNSFPPTWHRTPDGHPIIKAESVANCSSWVLEINPVSKQRSGSGEAVCDALEFQKRFEVDVLQNLRSSNMSNAGPSSVSGHVGLWNGQWRLPRCDMILDPWRYSTSAPYADPHGTARWLRDRVWARFFGNRVSAKAFLKNMCGEIRHQKATRLRMVHLSQVPCLKLTSILRCNARGAQSV